MYNNLETLIFKKKIAKREIAGNIGITYNTLLAKLSKKQSFKLDEAFAIRDLYFPDTKIDYLFATDSDTKAV